MPLLKLCEQVCLEPECRQRVSIEEVNPSSSISKMFRHPSKLSMAPFETVVIWQTSPAPLPWTR